MPGSIYGRGLRDIFPHFRDFSVYDLEEDGLDLPDCHDVITRQLGYDLSQAVVGAALIHTYIYIYIYSNVDS